MPQAMAKKREFGAITGRDVPDITAEANVQAAMMKGTTRSRFCQAWTNFISAAMVFTRWHNMSLL